MNYTAPCSCMPPSNRLPLLKRWLKRIIRKRVKNGHGIAPSTVQSLEPRAGGGGGGQDDDEYTAQQRRVEVE